MPGGRPLRVDQVVGHTATGEAVTVADRIIDSIRAGNYVETAAGMAGVNKTTVYDWIKTGARAYTRSHRNGEKLSPSEKRLAEFSNAVGQAVAESEAGDIARLDQLARGGMERTIITTRIDADGNQETTTRVERSLPDARVLMWRLERRFGERWGRMRIEVGEVSAPELAGIEDVKRLRDELAERRGRKASGE